MKQFYLFYSQDDIILHQVGAKLKNEKTHQPGAELQQLGISGNTGTHQVAAELQVIENKSNIIIHQVGEQFAIHPIFQIPWRYHVEIFTKEVDNHAINLS